MIRQNSELQERASEDFQLQNVHTEIEEIQRSFDLERRESQAQVMLLEEDVRGLKEAISQEENKSQLENHCCCFCCCLCLLTVVFNAELEEQVAALTAELTAVREAHVMNGGIAQYWQSL